EKAFERFSKLGNGNDEELFALSFMLSMLHSVQQNYRQAAEYLRRARKYFGVKDDEDMPEALIKMIEGMFYGSQGAENIFMSRMENLIPQTLTTLSGKVTVSDLLTFQGIEYFRRNQTDIGLECWRKGILFATELDDKKSLAQLHNLT